jgi:hypothetical protein
MSVPDSLGYFRLDLNVFVRVSEYEVYQNYGEEVCGIWLDAFKRQWYDEKVVDQLLRSHKNVAVVSPELHGRDHEQLWCTLKSMDTSKNSVMICTDFPLEAQRYFNE